MSKLTDATENASSDGKLFSIEELQIKHGTTDPVYKGICISYGWKPGRMVTEDEYSAACDKFSKSPIGKRVN